MTERRDRRRPMATGVWELFLGPVLCWAILVGNVFLAVAAVVAAVTAFSVPTPWGFAGNMVFATIAVLWLVLVAHYFVLTVYRPRRLASSVIPAGQILSDGVEIPGSRRIPVLTLVSAVAVIALLLAIANLAVEAGAGGWAIFCAVIVALLLISVVSLALTLRHRRFLILSPTGLRASVYRSDAELAWGDIEEISYVQGMTGTMVLRVGVKPGATSYGEHWRHPFSRNYFARDIGRIEVEPGALDVDALLLLFALRLFWLVPGSRAELGSGRAPARLFGAEVALSSTPMVVTEEPMTVSRITGKPLQLFRPRWE